MPRNLLSLHSSHFYSHEKGMGKLYSQEKSAHVLDFFFLHLKLNKLSSQPTTFLIKTHKYFTIVLPRCKN